MVGAGPGSAVEALLTAFDFIIPLGVFSSATFSGGT